jgi:hypothetical protein
MVIIELKIKMPKKYLISFGKITEKMDTFILIQF